MSQEIEYSKVFGLPESHVGCLYCANYFLLTVKSMACKNYNVKASQKVT